MCADAYLGQDEIENYFAFAEILGVEEDRAEELMDEFLEARMMTKTNANANAARSA